MVNVVKMKKVEGFWRFVERSLPSTLSAYTKHQGYGQVLCIGLTPAKGFKGLFHFREAIAFVELNRIELLEPQYYADIHALCESYERETGIEVTLKYWEGAS